MSPAGAPATVLVAALAPAEARLVAALDSAPGVVVVRRCADVVELLAASAAGLGRAALVSLDLPHLDAEALAALRRDGTAVLGVLADPADVARWAQVGVSRLVAPGADPGALAGAVRAALREQDRPAAAGPAPSGPSSQDRAASPGPAGADAQGSGRRVDGRHGEGGRDDGRQGADRDGAGAHGQEGGGQEERATSWQPRGAPGTAPGGPATAPLPQRPGRTVAVWGPAGAPGRTMVATSVATALAARGRATLLVDADTTAPSVALALGLLDESAGVAAACRAAARGSLGAAGLAALAPTTAGGLRVLTGLSRAARWPEVGATSLAVVLRTAAASHDWVVVDCATGVEQDEELSYDTAAPRRHGATLTALEQADEILVVGAGDPVGLQRLVRALSELREVAPGTPARTVVTQVRASAVGRSPAAQLRSALARFAGVDDPVLLIEDRTAYDAALLAGRSVTEHGPSALRRALLDLVDRLEGDVPGAAGPAGSAGRRGRRRPR